jgi:hypothetical protein
MMCGIMGFLSIIIPGIGVAIGAAWAATAIAVAPLVNGAVNVVANTIATGIIIGYNGWQEVNRNRLQIEANMVMGDWLDHMTNWANNFTSKAFGAAQPGDANLWDFVARYKPEFKDQEQRPDCKLIHCRTVPGYSLI